MIKSKRLDWSPTKIKKNFKSIRETGDFALDQRKVKSTVSKLNSESQAYLNDELSKDNSISLPTMKKLIFLNFGIDVSSSTIRWNLKKLGYTYQGPTIRPKMLRLKSKDIKLVTETSIW